MWSIGGKTLTEEIRLVGVGETDGHTHRHDEALRARKPDLGGPHPVPNLRITRAYILGSKVASAGRSQTDII
jgi:hypothetical protein